MKACVEQKCSVLYCCVLKYFWNETILSYMAMIAWDFRRESACLEFHHATVHCTKMRFLISLSCTGVVWERCEWDPCGWDGIGQDHPVHLGDSTHGWDGGEGPFSNCCPPLYRSQLGGRIQKVHTNCKPLIISHHTKITYNVDCIHYCLPVHSWQKKKHAVFRALTYKMWLSDWLNQSWFSFVQIPVVLYHGTIPERERLRRKMFVRKRKGKPEEFQPVVVTSYEICMKDQKFLCNRNWKFLVVDEGHRIKNLNCKLIKWVGRIAETLVSCKYNIYVSIAFQSSEVVWCCQQAAAHWHPAAE